MGKSTSTVGIIGLCMALIVPFVGITLGVISLSIKEKSVAIGVLSIVAGIVGMILWAGVYY